MDTLTITPTTWRGVKAHRILGSRLEAVLTVVGCHLACLRRRGEELNPLWQPQWPAGDPTTIKPGVDGKWGPGPDASMLSTIVGSNLCLDRFGPPWPGENRPVHGETNVVPWKMIAHATMAECTTALPEAKLMVRRRVRIDNDVLELSTGVCHDGKEARAVEWCEHTTIGDPFLDGSVFTAGLDAMRALPQGGGDPTDMDINKGLVMPAADAPADGSLRAGRVVAGWWTAENKRLGRRLTARWNREDFPWLCLWTEHKSRAFAPWSGRERTRGMEIATKPFPDGKPPQGRAEKFLGRPTTCLIQPGQWRDHVVRFAWQPL